MLGARRYFVGGHFWNIVAAALNQGSTLIANVCLANLLLPEEFGRYGAIQISLTAVAAATQLSASFSASYFAGRYRDSDPNKLGRILHVVRSAVAVASGCVALGLIVWRDDYSSLLFNDYGASAGVGAAALFVLFTGLNSYQIGLLIGLDALRNYARSSVVQGLATVIAVVGLGYATGVVGALLGLSGAAAIRWWLTGRLVRPVLARYGIRLHRDRLDGVLSEVLRFSLPASANGIIYMGSLWLAITAIARQPDGLIMSALYAAVMNIKTLVLFAPQQANAASVAYLSRHRADTPAAYGSAFRFNMLVVSGVALASAAIAAAFAPYILAIYGDTFARGTALLQVLMIAAVAEAVAYSLTQHFSSRGAMWTVLWTASVPRDLTVVVAVLYFMPTHGLNAVAWGFAVSWLLYSLGLLLTEVWKRR